MFTSPHSQQTDRNKLRSTLRHFVFFLNSIGWFNDHVWFWHCLKKFLISLNFLYEKGKNGNFGTGVKCKLIKGTKWMVLFFGFRVSFIKNVLKIILIFPSCFINFLTLQLPFWFKLTYLKFLIKKLYNFWVIT